MYRTSLKWILASALAVSGGAPALALPPIEFHVPPQGVHYERIPLTPLHPPRFKLPGIVTEPHQTPHQQLLELLAEPHVPLPRSAFPPLDSEARAVESGQIDAERKQMDQEERDFAEAASKRTRQKGCKDASGQWHVTGSAACFERWLNCRNSAFPASVDGATRNVTVFGDPYCFKPPQPGHAIPSFRIFQSANGQWMAKPSDNLPSVSP